jgi:hypothetical protein
VIIDRRTFIQISAPFVATAAALAILPARLPGASSPQLAGGNQDMKHPAFKIYGWDRRDESAGDGSKTSPADSVRGDSNRDEIFISINQSWRIAWR